jgi:hypothetical protein
MTGSRTILSNTRRLFSACWLCAALIAATTSPARATADKGDDAYHEFVSRVTAGDLSLDFRAFRLACLKASTCDPRGDNKDLISMQRSTQAKDYRKALKTAETLIEHGFVNIQAHVAAAQAYEALHNPEKARFHHDIAASLIRSILATGDGKTKETAFEVIGTFEEHLIMNVLGLPAFGSQSLIPGQPHSYDLLEVTDPRTGQKASVFFNIDLFYPPKGL